MATDQSQSEEQKDDSGLPTKKKLGNPTIPSTRLHPEKPEPKPGQA